MHVPYLIFQVFYFLQSIPELGLWVCHHCRHDLHREGGSSISFDGFLMMPHSSANADLPLLLLLELPPCLVPLALCLSELGLRECLRTEGSSSVSDLMGG